MSTQERLMELKKLRESGEYSVAKLEMLNKIGELEMPKKLNSHIEYLNEVFLEYLEELKELENVKPGLAEFLKAIMLEDVKANHCFEQEDPFFISLYSQMSKQTMMGKLIRFAKANKDLTEKNIFCLHDTLLSGTLSDGGSSIRTDNHTFVGSYADGKMEIDYFPIDYHDINEAAKALANLYNVRLDGELYNNLFLQPFLIHGLFAALQLFKDGNTRMGRVMQHALLWKNIGVLTDYEFDSPPIFATGSYFPYRGQYRAQINNLVINGDNEAWYKWFVFNLDRMEDSIDFNKKNIKELKRRRMI